MATISQINNKYQATKESTYGTVPGSFTDVDFGQIQRITLTGNENLEKIGSINGGHTYNLIEDGVYYVTGTLETLATKASLPNILDAFMGNYSDDGTDYTVTTDPSQADSYSFRVEVLDSGATNPNLDISGLVFTTMNIEIAKGGNLSVSMDFIAKKMEKVATALTSTANTDNIFKFLDGSITLGGNSAVYNNLTINATWNVTEDEGRGIESVSAGERRLIQRVTRHVLDVSGNFEMEVNDDFTFDYEDDQTAVDLVMTLSRSTDNDHVITCTGTKTENRQFEPSVDNSVRVFTADFQSLDFNATGDL